MQSAGNETADFGCCVYQHKIISASSAAPRLQFPNRVRGGEGGEGKGGNEFTGDTIDRG